MKRTEARACAWCSATEEESGPRLLRCGGCRQQWFCDKRCLREAWVKGGHKAGCKAAQKKRKHVRQQGQQQGQGQQQQQQQQEDGGTLRQDFGGVAVYEAASIDESGLLGTQTWQSSKALAAFLRSDSPGAAHAVPSLTNARCLELGAGTGLVSLVLAALGAHATATDYHPDILKLVKRSAADNGFTAPRLVTSILDWDDPTTFLTPPSATPATGTAAAAAAATGTAKGGGFDLIIAADCIYVQTSSALVATLAAHIPRGCATPVLIGYQHRNDRAVSFFEEMLGLGFQFRRLEDANAAVVASTRAEVYRRGQWREMAPGVVELWRAITEARPLLDDGEVPVQLLLATRQTS
eukprot:COSAG01_NODE_1690_length_9443_cov_19.011078_10_plen_352_part_00